MLALADDAALARLVIAAARQGRARLPPRSFPIARSRACPCGLERSPDANSHGKVADGYCFSVDVIYACWFIYHLTCLPLLPHWKDHIAPMIEVPS